MFTYSPRSVPAHLLLLLAKETELQIMLMEQEPTNDRWIITKKHA